MFAPRAEIIPGALLREANGSHQAAGLRNGSVVLYVAGSDWDGTDGGGKQRIGVATGRSLEALSLHSQFLLEGTPGTRDERSVFPNGALLLDNGTVALTYMGQAKNDSWGGIFLATSDCPIGCPWRKHGVVLGCGGDAAHTSGADPQASKPSKPLKTVDHSVPATSCVSFAFNSYAALIY